MMRHIAFILLLAIVAGCQPNDESSDGHDSHDHDFPPHTPHSLWDLAEKIRARVDRIERSPSDHEANDELNDLIGWSAEIAADTEIGERRWLPIYRLSEEIRVAIVDDPERWDQERRDQAIRLCQLAEDAWRDLAPEDRLERFLGHHHEHDDHDHEHDDHDHNHDDHDDEHDEHDHEHDDHGEPESKHDDDHAESQQ